MKILILLSLLSSGSVLAGVKLIDKLDTYKLGKPTSFTVSAESLTPIKNNVIVTVKFSCLEGPIKSRRNKEGFPIVIGVIVPNGESTGTTSAILNHSCSKENTVLEVNAPGMTGEISMHYPSSPDTGLEIVE